MPTDEAKPDEVDLVEEWRVPEVRHPRCLG